MAKFVALVAVIVAIIVAVSASYSAQHEGVTFESWLLEHPKAYSDAYSNSFNGFEYELRRQIFLTNMKTIRAHNERFEAGLETWWMKPTQFADLTEAEFVKNHLGLAKGTQTNGSSTARRLNSLKATSLQIKDFEPIDWQKAGVMPTAPNQGSCGSCWANAAANVLTGRINQKFGTKAENYVSRQQINACSENPLECGGTGGCNGATAQIGFDHLVKSGVVLEKDYPYTSGSGSTGKCMESGYNPAFSITGHKDVTPNDKQALFDALKEGPVAVSAYASGWSFYGGGIFNKCDGLEVNHAITLSAVGVENGNYYWTIMNSWGSGWGENGGYMRLYMTPPDQDERCGEDKSPFDGSACKKSPEPPRTLACGCNGILYDSAVPTGIEKL